MQVTRLYKQAVYKPQPGGPKTLLKNTQQPQTFRRSEELCICWYFVSGNSWCIVQACRGPKAQAHENTMKNVWNPRRHLLKHLELVLFFQWPSQVHFSIFPFISNLLLKKQRGWTCLCAARPEMAV